MIAKLLHRPTATRSYRTVRTPSGRTAHASTAIHAYKLSHLEVTR